MERGYVKLWRKTRDSGLLQNPTAWQVFGFLLLNATHAPTTLIIDGTVVKLNPGQFATGRKRIASELNISEQQVRTALLLLKKLEIITSESTNRCTIFSFKNWDTYQTFQPAGQPTERQTVNQHLTNSQPTPNQHLTTKQEQENIRTKEQEKNTSLTPSGFQAPSIEEVEEYISQKNLNVSAEEFVEHYTEAGWLVKGKPMKSWKLTLRTWHRKEKPIVDPLAHSFGDQPPYTKQQQEWIAAVHREYDPMVKTFREAGRMDLALKYEEVIRHAVLDIEAGIPYEG